MNLKEKRNGIIAGISLIIMAIFAGFSYGYAHNTLVADSPEATLKNLIANKSLFYAELSGWSTIFVTDIIVAISLYFFFRSTSKQISMITAVIRVIYTLMLGAAIIQLFKIMPVLSMENPLSNSVYTSESSSHFQGFENLWSVGLIIFGFHLIGLGCLALKSKVVPRFLGYLLYFGGIGYVFIHSARHMNLFETNIINTAETVLALPMALAEILLAFWLIYNGFRNSSAKIQA